MRSWCFPLVQDRMSVMWPVVSLRPSGGVIPIWSNPEIMNVGRSEDGLAADQRVRTQIQPERPGIEGVVGVVEGLIEGTDPKQYLVGQLRREHGIPYQGVVLYVQRSDLEVVAQVRAGRRQRQAESGRLGLAALSAKPAERQRVVWVDVPVNLGNAVVAVAGSCTGGEIVVQRCRQANDGTGPKVRSAASWRAGSPEPRTDSSK